MRKFFAVLTAMITGGLGVVVVGAQTASAALSSN